MVMAYQTVDEDLFGFRWPFPWQEVHDNGGCSLQVALSFEDAEYAAEKMI